MRRTIVIATLAGLVGAMIAVPVAVYASHSFNDVPNSNTFHADIAWLADAGVTRGCNPPANTEFCPDDPVTRAQMSAFMRRFAQYMGAEDGTPAQADHANTADSADNADMLQGNTVAELVPRAAFNSTDNATDGQDLTLTAEITAPAPGILILSGTVDARNLGDFNIYSCELLVNGGLVPGTSMFSQLDGDPFANTQNAEEDCTTTGAVAVDAGTHDIDFIVVDVADTTELFATSVWAMWIPFDGTGSVPASVTQLGDPDTIDARTREGLDD